MNHVDAGLSVAAALLRPGGWLRVSIFHPCYPGGEEGSSSRLPIEELAEHGEPSPCG